MTLETAVILPFLIIGILTLGFTIRIISIGENTIFSAVDEARVSAERAYHVQVTPFFPTEVENRIIQENASITSVKMEQYHYLYQSNGLDGLIDFTLEYWIKTGLPLGFLNEARATQTLLYRGFVGRSESGIPFSFEKMESSSDGNLVWVFPNGGKRYHTRTCSFVSSYPARMVLNKEIRNNYQPCQKCHSEIEEDGNLIFCYLEYGTAYHLETCPTVDKYIISMEKVKAEELGYTPCLKCGGIE